MKIAKLALLMTSAFALAACGGGGSGGGSAPQAKPENVSKPAVKPNTTQSNGSGVVNTTSEKPKTPQVTKPVEQPKKPEAIKPETIKPSEPEKVVTPPKENKPSEIEVIKQREFPKGEVKNEDVGFGVVTGYNNKYSFNGAWKESKPKSELTELVIENTKMKLAKTILGAAGGLQKYAAATAFESAWNVLTDDGSQRDTFYFGDETPVSVIDNMKGKATYKGNATRYDNISAKLDNIGTSTLNVDFDTKKISGELAIKGLHRRNISLEEGDIKGNAFEGKAIAGKNHILRQVEGAYEGKFFGPNAEEIAGKAKFKGEAIVGKLEDLNTSFSAEKQAK